jgi:hypothetical protein
LGEQSGGSGRQATQRIGRERNWRLVVVVAFMVALFGSFVVVVLLDARQQTASGPPSGVEDVDVGSAGQHTEGVVDYAQIPPAGGKHNPIWQNAGFYEEPVRDENAVHTLEHGAVWITYSPDLPANQVETIRDLVEGQDCVLASPYEGLLSLVVASAWGKQLSLEGVDETELERFIGAYRQGPQTPEPGASCTGGLGESS